MNPLQQIDTYLLLLINTRLVHPWLDTFFVAITDSSFWIVPGVAAAVLYLRVTRVKGLAVLLVAGLTVAITDPLCVRVLKPWVHRLRPCDPSVHFETVRCLLGLKQSLSFPSAHAMNSFGQAMYWALMYPRWAWGAFGLAAVVSYSRVYVGVHWPFDIVAGALFGSAVGGVVYLVYWTILSWAGRRSVDRGGPENTGCR